ncbi:hypothetical protein AB2M95_25870 [Pseudomonas chlororaphis]|uniref:hypothetical protein n=1 Tax=Pseudomonas chlororaphis TaxID=587753 RepID=UPI0034620B69
MGFLKGLLFKAFIFVWQLLRFFVAIFLLVGLCYYIFIVMFSPKVLESVEPVSTQSICGRLSGRVIVVPRNYVVFWAEYEGESSWDKNTFHSEKTCDANMTSLPMVVSWPDFQPANQSKYFSEGLRFDGLEIVVSPIKYKGFDLRSRLAALLGTAKGEEVEGATYIEELGLYFVKRKDRSFPEILNGYYWSEEGGEVQAVFECLGDQAGEGFYNCRGEFVFSQLDALMKVGFTPEKLKAWKRIVSLTEEFVLSKVEK